MARIRRALAAAAAAALALTACSSDGAARPRPTPSSTPSTTTARPIPDGAVRVAVPAEPDPEAPTLAGAGVRALVLPQLFVARPDGDWAPSVVEPGSDEEAPDRRTASFRLRAGAAWSTGQPVTADDLRRSADRRFVAGVDGPAPDGRITVRFTHPLPGWRRLWSHTDSIAPPAAGVWGGPFLVAERTPGLETVLRPNPGWRGDGPFLAEVRLVLVPDPTTARQLLAREEVDVVMPPAATVRISQHEAVTGVETAIARRTGWTTSLVLGERVPTGARAALVAAVERTAFVDRLLQHEATRLDGFAGPEDATWSGVRPGDASGMRGRTVQLLSGIDEPMAPLLGRSLHRRVRSAGGTVELVHVEAEVLEKRVRDNEVDAAILTTVDPPDICWTCRWGSVDPVLAAGADAGDAAAAAALEARLRDERLLLPLWRHVVVVAWRTSAVDGVRANGYALSAAAGAWEWRRPR